MTTSLHSATLNVERKYILSIDQGTTSSRAILFNKAGENVAQGQLEHEQIFPKAGWVEHNATEIWQNVRKVVAMAMANGEVNHHEIAAVGITNQRETTVVWDKNTGEPVYNGDLLFGNTDTWLVWNLTGGVDGGVHVTDVTNASRTLLMDIRTLEWDPQIAADMGIPMSMLPEIKSSSEVYGFGRATGLLSGTPIAGILGDQQAATFGQACFEKGMAKNTYGTGNFMLMNTGNEPVFSNNGLLTTVAYKIGDAAPVYALEGSVAMSGSLIQWLRDNLRMIEHAAESEELATSVKDSGGCYVVPAFSGLFAPHWRSDARGVIVGLTRYVNRAHIVRAALEATAFQTREVLDAMNADSGVELSELRVDGGMTANEFLMQFQADILGVPVIRPKVVETTALGAAYAAGIAVGFWSGEQDVVDNWAEDKRWLPSMEPAEVDRQYRLWKKAVSRTLEWVDEDVPTA